MCTHEDASLFRLKMLKERIQSVKKEDLPFLGSLPTEIIEIVGIDLYRSIKKDDRLWQEWNKRIHYFQSLAGEQDFFDAEEKAKEATKKVVATLIKIIESHPKGKDPKYGNMFFAEIKGDFPVDVDYPLPEKLKPYLKDENYFSIKDQGQFMVAPSGRVWSLVAPPYDVGIYHNCNKVMTQHQDVYHFVQRFVDTKMYDEIVRGKEEKENELAAAFQELAQAIEPLELFLFTDAKALHTRSFERVELAAAAFDDTVMGRHTKGFQSLEKDEQDEKRLEEIRKAGIDVCDELSYALLLSNQGIKRSKADKKTSNVQVKHQSKKRQHKTVAVSYARDGQIGVCKGEDMTLTFFGSYEKDLCRAVFEKTSGEDKNLPWDELYQSIEGQEPPDQGILVNKQKIRKWKKQMTDARTRINSKVTSMTGLEKPVEVIGLIKGETTFVRGW